MFSLLIVGLIGLAAFLAGIISLVSLVADAGSHTVVHEIAVTCYFILTVVSVHCGHYLNSLREKDEQHEG